MIVGNIIILIVYLKALFEAGFLVEVAGYLEETAFSVFAAFVTMSCVLHNFVLQKQRLPVFQFDM